MDPHNHRIGIAYSLKAASCSYVRRHSPSASRYTKEKKFVSVSTSFFIEYISGALTIYTY